MVFDLKILLAGCESYTGSIGADEKRNTASRYPYMNSKDIPSKER